MFAEIDFMFDGLVTDSTLVILSRLMNRFIMDFERLRACVHSVTVRA
jgi:hypothetical protein